jgi:hypothetical protein
MLSIDAFRPTTHYISTHLTQAVIETHTETLTARFRMIAQEFEQIYYEDFLMTDYSKEKLQNLNKRITLLTQTLHPERQEMIKNLKVISKHISTISNMPNPFMGTLEEIGNLHVAFYETAPLFNVPHPPDSILNCLKLIQEKPELAPHMLSLMRGMLFCEQEARLVGGAARYSFSQTVSESSHSHVPPSEQVIEGAEQADPALPGQIIVEDVD